MADITSDTPIKLTDRITCELVDHMGDDLALASAAWVSTHAQEAEKKATEDPYRVPGLIGYLMRHRHGTPFEHSSLKFRVHAPIFVYREWHRHRIGFSYNEQSARYMKLEPVFWMPKPGRPLMQDPNFSAARPVFAPASPEEYKGFVKQINYGYHVVYQIYVSLLDSKFDPGAARCVLPVGIYSSMYVTCNPRSVMHFLSLRTHRPDALFVSYPLKEIEEAAEAMETAFAKLFPITHKAFNDNGRVAP